jgi:hypothetical protein
MKRTIVMIIISITVAVFILTGTCHSLTIIDIDAEVSGWVRNNGDTNGRDASTTNFITGNTASGGLKHSNFFVFHLNGIEGRVKSATLKLQNPNDGFYSFDNVYFEKSDYYTYSITGINEREEGGLNSSDLLPQNWSYPYTGIATWSIINNGTPKSYGDVQVNETSNGAIVEIALNSEGLADLNLFLESLNSNGYYALGGRIILPNTRELHIFSNTGGNLYSRVLSLEMYESGDVNNDGEVNLTDVVLSLQVCSGVQSATPVVLEAEVNNDNKIGIADAIFILQTIAGLR